MASAHSALGIVGRSPPRRLRTSSVDQSFSTVFGRSPRRPLVRLAVTIEVPVIFSFCCSGEVIRRPSGVWRQGVAGSASRQGAECATTSPMMRICGAVVDLRGPAPATGRACRRRIWRQDASPRAIRPKALAATAPGQPHRHEKIDGRSRHAHVDHDGHLRVGQCRPVDDFRVLRPCAR